MKKTGSEHHGRRWAAAVAVVAGLAGTLTAARAAPAAADVPDHEFVRHSGSPTSTSSRVTSAFCPVGKDLIGTGGRVLGGGGNVLLESIVPDLDTDGVVVSARENLAGTSSNWQVEAVAVCADDGSVPGMYLVDSVDTTSSGADEAASTRANCDEGDQVLGVGFELSGAPGRLHLTTLMPTENSVVAVGHEDAAGTTAPWDVTVFGICAPLSNSQVHTDSNTSDTSSGSHWSTASCPDDFNVTSGGGTVYESGSSGHVTLYSFSPGSFEETDYATTSSLEPPPGTTGNSTLYSYVVCADLR
jgi:hypothetical protein